MHDGPCKLRVHPDDLIFPRTSLAHCFTHLASTVDRIVGIPDTP
ncbi:MAG TPA: hypothetical protein VMA55_16675 [Acidovorax sp.]|nr:hypothetical protein [Acidovorax sp.]